MNRERDEERNERKKYERIWNENTKKIYIITYGEWGFIIKINLCLEP